MIELSGQRHICAAGETFDSVALEEYGDGIYAAQLMAANPALCGRLRFAGDEVLELPVIDIPEQSGAEDYTPASAPWKEG